jgi:hypothetical protein
MKKYNFLFKPAFFIVSLLFATWLVFYIDKLSPPEPDKSSSLPRSINQWNNKNKRSSDKIFLKRICCDYKSGLIDSAAMDRHLESFIDSIEISTQK